ncbi:putative transcriptional regulator [Calothrix sp. NIES-2100]|nr:putative transcriptional regulator [Calothrix sp. NIES-2100]
MQRGLGGFPHERLHQEMQRCLFVRSGNLTSKLTTDEEIENYCKSRW